MIILQIRILVAILQNFLSTIIQRDSKLVRKNICRRNLIGFERNLDIVITIDDISVVTQYTGLSEVTGDESPTYANVGTADGIANSDVMESRIEAIRENGTDAEIDVFPGPHGGIGVFHKRG